MPGELIVIDDICEACGERNPAGSQFCLFCGVFLGWDEAARRAAPPEGAQNEVPPDGARKGAPPDSSRVAQTTVIPTAAGPDLAPTTAKEGPGGPQTAKQGAPPSASSMGSQPATAHRGSPGTPVRPACPDCGRVNEPERRFCSTCGYALSAGVPARPLAAPSRNWWQQFTDPKERKARRAYRHALPPLYRWRRVLIGVLVPVALFTILTVVGRDPAAWAKARWYDVNGDVVEISVVKAENEPRGSARPGTSATYLVDNLENKAWATKWVPRKERSGYCGVTPKGVGQVLLTIPPTRIREIRIDAGMTDPAQRAFQFLPKSLDVTLSNKTCRTVNLQQVNHQQKLKFDSKTEVTSVRIAVATAFPPDERAAKVVAISEISLMSRPPVHGKRTAPGKASK